MSTKQYSFWNLISEYCIEIPAIQRDYAQGRKSESRIANALIDDLFRTLISLEAKKINLHFVYGKVENGHLIPLDGQQRLTTLFLLHWFLSINNTNEITKKTLSKFTYETRPSTEDFCFKLIKEDFLFEENIKISEQIENSKWFFLSWKNDPTITSMLNMLDIIQSKFGHPNKTMFTKLTSEDCPIQFHFLPLEKFKLDDKIYVKMNSRGKPLTDFENFKANFSVLFDIDNKSKFDNEWLDIFWKFEKTKNHISIKDVDAKYLNFIKNATLSFYVETNDIDKKAKDNFNIFDEYKNVYFPGSPYLWQISKVLDALTSFKDEKQYLERFLEDDPEYSERLRYYAVMQFFIKKGNLNGSNSECFEKWMRVSINLINNTLIQSPDTFYRAVRSIKRLSDNLHNLYEYLSNVETKIEGFLQRQIDEEKLKAALILKDENWKNEIYSAELHNYFSGQIGFILEFSKKENDYDLELFKNYSSKLKTLFSAEFKDNHNCLFQRALLTFGDYLVSINYCKTFCTFNSSLRDKMDNWRKVFEDSKRKFFLKELLDFISIDTIKSDLQKIISNYIEDDWKGIFIKNKGILEYCDKYRISHTGNKVLLSRSPADNWRRHADLYSFALFLELKKENKNVEYRDSSDETPWIFIDWKGKSYYIQEEGSNYTFGYCIGNNDAKGLTEMQQFVEEIISKKSLNKL